MHFGVLVVSRRKKTPLKPLLALVVCQLFSLELLITEPLRFTTFLKALTIHPNPAGSWELYPVKFLTDDYNVAN
jgi:hypothetical protein